MRGSSGHSKEARSLDRTELVMIFESDFLIVQLVTGVARAMMLFLLSAGLSLIFGVMNILNFAHATFLLLGGYIIYSIYSFIGPGIPMFLVAVAAGCPIMAALGFVLERSIDLTNV